MTKRSISEYGIGETLCSLYGWDLKPDPVAVKAREKKVAKLKAMLGDKYRLAKPVEKVGDAE
jgi:hypothetical protein